MVNKASCPTKEDLIQLNQGDLPGDQLESVCDHVEICEKCQLILGQLDEPPNNIGKQLAKITPEDLENARIAIEEETLKDRATMIWGQLTPSQKNDREPTLTVPCNLRQYEVLRLIGYGGMGEVYEGRHSNLKRPVALKVIQGIRQDDPIAYEHFLREMETAGQLEHPNLVRLTMPGNTTVVCFLLRNYSMEIHYSNSPAKGWSGQQMKSLMYCWGRLVPWNSCMPKVLSIGMLNLAT